MGSQSQAHAALALSGFYGWRQGAFENGAGGVDDVAEHLAGGQGKEIGEAAF